MYDHLKDFAEFVQLHFGYRNVLYIPLIQLLVIYIFCKEKFWDTTIFIFGIVNFIGVFLWLSFIGYLSKAIPKGGLSDWVDYISSDLHSTLIFNGLALILALIYFFINKIRKHPKTSNITYKRLYGLTTIIALYLGWVFIWGVQGDAADCEKLPTQAETDQCRKNW